MKSFICAIIIILLLMSLTLVNALIISSSLTKLLSEISALPKSVCDMKNIESISEKWYDIRSYLCITVKESILKEGDNLVRSLKYAVRYKNTEQYQYYTDALYTLISDLKKADIPYPFESVIT